MVASTDRAGNEALSEMLRRGDTLAGTSPVGAAPEVTGGLVATAPAPGLLGAPVALIERAQAGERAAFDLLVEQRLERAFRTARAILGNEADARDATQEAFLHAWRDLPRLRDPERFEAWLGRILVNSCREALRGRRRRFVREIAASDLGDPVVTLAARDPLPDERSAALDLLERAFDALSVGERSILVLHHLEHRPLAEIASTLAIPTGTAKSRLHAARHSLERALEAELR